MRVHDMPPIPPDFYLLRPAPKPPDPDTDALNETARQEAQRRIAEEAEDRQRRSRQQDRRHVRPGLEPAPKAEEGIAQTSTSTGPDHIDLLA